MFENFSFGPAPSSEDAAIFSLPCTSTSRPRKQCNPSAYALTEPLTPPLSPLHSPNPSPIDAESCFSYFDSLRNDDPLTSTMASFSLSPKSSQLGYSSPDSSDNEVDPFEDVRRKRQSMARMQTNDDMLRQLGELVKRVSPPSSRKGSAGSLVETSGVMKRSNNNTKARSRSKTTKSREPCKGSGRRVAA